MRARRIGTDRPRRAVWEANHEKQHAVTSLEAGRSEHPAEHRVRYRCHTYFARQHLPKMLQSVAVSSGTGKSHLSIALGIRACLAGHRVAFATASQWVDRLGAAHDAGKLQDELTKLSRYPLVIIDEVGYIPFQGEAANLFFQLVSSRYERASMIVSSNKAFSKAHTFGRTCARWCLNNTGSSHGAGKAARIDAIGEVVDEAFGFHAECLPGDLRVKHHDEIDDARRSKTLRRHASGIEHVAQVGRRRRCAARLRLGRDDYVRIRGTE